MLDHLETMLGLCWGLLGRLGPMLAHLGTMLGVPEFNVGPSWLCVGLSWGHLGTMLGLCWVLLGRLGPMLAHLGTMFYVGPSWLCVGLSWGYVAPSWDYVEGRKDIKVQKRYENMFPSQ